MWEPNLPYARSNLIRGPTLGQNFPNSQFISLTPRYLTSRLMSSLSLLRDLTDLIDGAARWSDEVGFTSFLSSLLTALMSLLTALTSLLTALTLLLAGLTSPLTVTNDSLWRAPRPVKILVIVKKQHLLLCTLLICDAAAVELGVLL